MRIDSLGWRQWSCSGDLVRFVSTLVLCLPLCSGCGGGDDLPERAPVTGTVTYKGKTLAGGTVTFYPDEEKGNPAYGEIQSDGTFHLTTYEAEDGAVLGKHRVTVEVFPGQAGGAETGLPGAEATLPSPIPIKYRDRQKSPLEFEVKPGENKADLTLTD
jgi:hypothetical protein